MSICIELDKKRLLSLFGIKAPVSEWLLLSLCGVLAIILGLFSVDISSAKLCIQYGGYWQMWVFVLMAGGYAYKYLRKRFPVYHRWGKTVKRRSIIVPVLAIAGASVFAHMHFPHRLKIMHDEAVLLNTSAAMHQYRLVYTPVTAEYRNGNHFLGTGYTDKRPYLQPFLVSVLHDLLGYRPTNPILLNVLITPGLFLYLFLLGRRLQRRYGGGLAVVLGMGVPIFWHANTGGGFEGLNLLLLLAVTYHSMRCWRCPSPDQIGLCVAGACLLAHCRYESALYLVSVGVVVFVALRRLNLKRIPPLLYIAPLLLISVPWLQRIAFAQEKSAFQLNLKDAKVAFSASFFPGNLASASQYFLVLDPANLSSPLVTAFGVIGIIAMALLMNRARLAIFRAGCADYGVFLIFALATLGNMLLFLFFAYGQYSEYITQRISIPVYGTLILLAIVPLAFRRAGRLAPWMFLGAVANLVCVYLPAANNDYLSHEYTVSKDYQFVDDFISRMDHEEGVLVVTHNPLAWQIRKVACALSRGPLNVEGIDKILRAKEFNRILVHTYITRSKDNIGFGYYSPPVWLDRVQKRIIAERWLAAGVIDIIYEIVPPPIEIDSVTSEAGAVPGPTSESSFRVKGTGTQLK